MKYTEFKSKNPQVRYRKNLSQLKKKIINILKC